MFNRSLFALVLETDATPDDRRSNDTEDDPSEHDEPEDSPTGQLALLSDLKA